MPRASDFTRIVYAVTKRVEASISVTKYLAAEGKGTEIGPAISVCTRL